MIRAIYCTQPDCEHTVNCPTDPIDAAAGWSRRWRRFACNQHLRCDYCNAEIIPGDEVIAQTQWNTNREGTPYDWEQEFRKDPK